ncbi:sigma-70 family RNA polymerase sigma factor [Singulisphaera sp. PoT]|uniref:sigma-70 family RNA polymerase sigma factor n=1 Tax=Singulisphaera sp. PoT TaxID=3411797 RepID=UPI003BF51957
MQARGQGAIRGNLHALLEGGSLGGLTDRQLLERFTSRDDGGSDAAFRTLMDRHGRMVLGVCRRILGDSHDAEDAFQATFLILVRKAESVRVSDSLGRWLYGVSCRVARRAKSTAARRGSGESIATLPAPHDPSSELEEIRALVDEELLRLPARFRTPIVLCDLDGFTHEQAARQLGCPVGTIKSRLARGRGQLRDRLVRRGWSPAASFTALTLATSEVEAAVPHLLVETTIREAVCYLCGTTAMAVTSAVSLAEGVLKAMFMSKLLCGVGAIALAGALVGSAVYGSGSGAGDVQEGSKARNDAVLESKSEQASESSKPNAIIEHLKAELAKKKAELDRGKAEKELVLSVLATSVRLNQRIQGTVSADEFKKAEAEVKVAEAKLNTTLAEIHLLEVMVKQASGGSVTVPTSPEVVERAVDTQGGALERRLQTLESKIDHVLEELNSLKERNRGS